MFLKKLTLISITFSWFISVQSNFRLRQGPSDWEHVLRELIFNTISPAPVRNDNLYKQLLTAPFYKGGTNSNLSSVTDTIISQGKLFFLPNNKWIFCQDECQNCNECLTQKNPTIKWILRRIRRSLNRSDLQFTIIPQIDGSFHIKNIGLQAFVYVVTEGKNKNLVKNIKLEKTSAEENVYPKFNLTSKPYSEFQNDDKNEELYVLKENSSTLKIFGKTEAGPIQGVISNNSDTFHSYVILGIDYLGTKYLIQVMQVYNAENNNSFYGNLQEEKGTPAPTIILTTPSSRTNSSFRNILQSIITSLNNNKRFIEKFLTDSENGTLEKKKNMYIKLEDLKLVNGINEITKMFNEGNFKHKVNVEIKIEDKTSNSEMRIRKLNDVNDEDNLRMDVFGAKQNDTKPRIPRINRSKYIWGINKLNKTRGKREMRTSNMQ